MFFDIYFLNRNREDKWQRQVINKHKTTLLQLVVSDGTKLIGLFANKGQPVCQLYSQLSLSGWDPHVTLHTVCCLPACLLYRKSSLKLLLAAGWGMSLLKETRHTGQVSVRVRTYVRATRRPRTGQVCSWWGLRAVLGGSTYLTTNSQEPIAEFLDTPLYLLYFQILTRTQM